MRRFAWILVAMTLGCGNTNDGVQTSTPVLPLGALAVAKQAAARFGMPLAVQAVDPSIATDLIALEDDGCFTDATTPSPLAANANTYSITTTYSNCSSSVASNITGSRTLNVSVDDTNNITTLGSTFQVALIPVNTNPINLSCNTHATLNGNIATGSITRTYTTTGSWTTPGASQGAVQNFNNTLSLADTYDMASGMPTSTTLDGAYSEAYAGTPQGFTATYNGVILNYAQCCIPIGGSITESQIFNDGSTDTTTWTFGSTCGVVSINGQSITLNGCP